MNLKTFQTIQTVEQALKFTNSMQHIFSLLKLLTNFVKFCPINELQMYLKMSIQAEKCSLCYAMWQMFSVLFGILWKFYAFLSEGNKKINRVNIDIHSSSTVNIFSNIICEGSESKNYHDLKLFDCEDYFSCKNNLKIFLKVFFNQAFHLFL